MTPTVRRGRTENRLAHRWWYEVRGCGRRHAWTERQAIRRAEALARLVGYEVSWEAW